MYLQSLTVASHRLGVMVSEVTGHASTSAVKEIVGAGVSNIIVSLISVDRLPALSLYLTRTVFVPSHTLHDAHS